MLLKNRKSPGIFYLRLFFIIILVAFSYLADFLLVDRHNWVEVVWVVPISASAIWLGPKETMGTSLVALILSLSIGADTGSQVNLWTSAAVGIFGVTMTVISSQVRRSYAQANIVHEALSDSPLAFAELRFPGYALINHNDSLRRLTGGGEPSADPLPAQLPEEAGARLSALMDEAVVKGQQVNDPEFKISNRDGSVSFWNISAIPVTAMGRRTPRSVALFASEVTEAVQRAANRDAALRISKAVMSNLDLEETVSVALESLMYIAGANAGALFLLEDEQWLGYAGAGDYDDDLVRSLRFPYDELDSGVKAINLRRTIMIERSDSEPRGKLASAEQLQLKSSLVIPLITGNRALGAVWCTQTDELQDFSEEQVEFATVVGAQVALAIENATIYGNEYAMRKSLEAIESISEAGLASLDIEEVLMELVTRTQDVMQMDAAMILLVDDKGEQLDVRAVTGSVARTANGGSIKVGEGLAGKAFSQGEPMKIDNVREHEPEMCPFAEGSGIRSILAVPLKRQGQTVGVLQIGSLREAAFAAREWGLIQVLADRASHAVQNSILHEQTKKELCRAALLRDVAAACAGSQDMSTIAAEALEAVYQQLGCDVASIYYLDNEAGCLVNLAFMGHGEDIAREFQRIPLDRMTFLVKAVLEQSVVTHDTHPSSGASETELAILESLGAMHNRRAALPIIFRGETVGGIALTMPGKQPFTAGEIDTFTSIANQLAVAIGGRSRSGKDRPRPRDNE
ncbi:MAG: GAF domain-containing protein [Thermoleophilia bacterium]